MKHLLRFTVLVALFAMPPVSIFSQEKYAVIITGDYADLQGSWATVNGKGRSAMEEFWNDTYLMWEMLIEKGYSNDNIFVLFADSSDFQPSWIYKRYNPQIYHEDVVGLHGQITDYKATKEMVEMVLTSMADGLNPDIPQITEDDFLYVYTFGHGYHAVSEPGGTEIARTFLCLMDYNWDVPDTEWDSIHSITDIELANLLDSIPANKKLIVMQQCSSGGFIEELAEYNVVISTAANDSMGAKTADNRYYDSIDFVGDTMPGNYYSVEENEQYLLDTNNHKYVHGEFNIHFISSTKGLMPDDLTDIYAVPGYQDFPLYDADANTDNIISIIEAYNWVLDFDSKMIAADFMGHDDPQLSHSDSLAKYTSLEYPTLMFENIENTISKRGIIGITKDVHITPINQLTFINNADVYLLNDAKLIVDLGATLVLEDNVSIIARGGINSLIVNGNLQIGNNIVFNSETENSLEIEINDYQDLNITLNYPEINNTFINSKATSFSIYHANVNTSLIEQNGGDFTIAFSVLGSSSVKAVNNPDIENYCHIFQNTFTDGLANNEAVITIDGYKKYAISDNTIFNNIETATQSYGIFINNSGSDRGHYYGIDENTIYSEITNESSVGIGVYSSYAKIENNYIYDNYWGIGIFNNSIVEIMGNQDETNTQKITNNSMYQVYLSSTVFPTSFHWNMIYGSTLSDFFIYREIDTSGTYTKADVRFNYWGGVSNVASHLYPANHYGFEPIWNLGGGIQMSQTSAGLLYETAIQQVEDSAYIPAKSTFKQVVINYPETDYALSSMREILYLEPLANYDFVALQNWFLTEPTILQNEVLKKLGENLANKCDERLENYPDAIAWYESVIENPETMEDSIFAIIDLEHLYLQMGIDTSLRSFGNYVGKFTQYKPSSYVEHQVHRDELLSLFSGKTKLSDKQDLNSENDNALGELMQNAPNPFSGSTTIEYNLKESSEVEINVFDQTGKIVLETKFFKPSGSHKYIPKTTNLPNGVYFYSLSLNGIQTDVKKMVLLK